MAASAPRSAFEEFCEEKNVRADEWRKTLSTPVIAEKCLVDMTEEEMEEHYRRVEDRANSTKEDRALIVLERTQDGRLERQAKKVFEQWKSENAIRAEQVAEMLESLRYELTNTEVHYLLKKFGATEDFDMVPEAQLTRRQWLWLVGECQMLKETYKHVSRDAFEVSHEASVQNLKKQREAGLEGTNVRPHIPVTGPGWFWNGGAQPGYKGESRPYVWGLNPEEEEELAREMRDFEEKQRQKSQCSEVVAGVN